MSDYLALGLAVVLKLWEMHYWVGRKIAPSTVAGAAAAGYPESMHSEVGTAGGDTFTPWDEWPRHLLTMLNAQPLAFWGGVA